MTPQRKRTLATVMVVILAAPAIMVAMSVLRRTASSAAPTTSTLLARDAITFVGATGWSGARGSCTEVRPEDGCDSQWHHDGGQVVRVFIVDVPDQAALDGFVQRLEKSVRKSGGLVERVPQGELTLVRFLQVAPGGLATVNYALARPGSSALHLITSVVPLAEQEDADRRLRALLEHATWSAAAPPTPAR